MTVLTYKTAKSLVIRSFLREFYDRYYRITNDWAENPLVRGVLYVFIFISITNIYKR